MGNDSYPEFITKMVVSPPGKTLPMKPWTTALMILAACIYIGALLEIAEHIHIKR